MRLNRIRNQVMHPVRGEQLREEHFEFVRDLRIKLGFRIDVPTTEGMPNQISQEAEVSREPVHPGPAGAG
jgi:hypothetical protein